MKINQFDGRIIHEPGLYQGIHIDDYHGNPFLLDRPSISSTGIRQVIDRPSLYWCYSPYNKDREERSSSKALNFGKAAHLLILEDGEGFKDQFAVRPERAPDGKAWNGNNLSCKEWLAEQEQARRAVLTQADIETIYRMRDKLVQHPIIRGGILDGLTEISMFARHGDFWLRARPDKIPPYSGDFVDLKTTESVSYDDVERSIFKCQYHVQAAMVRMVAEKVMPEGFEWGGFAFVFVEKSPPYDVRVFQLRDADIELGMRQINAAMKMLHECVKRWRWPGDEGFDQSISNVGLPSWARTRIETNLVSGD